KDYLIEETAVPFKIDDQTIILSAFKDITRQKKSEKDWANLVIIDQRTGIQNKFAFESRVEEYFKGKTTFLLIELRDLDLLQSLYGLPMVEKYFNAFIDFSKAYFDDIYLFDVNKIMAIINANDIRTIEKSIKTY